MKSIWPRVEKEKSGFTHHKESLCHHIPFYKGSESAPPFGLIYERERKREVVMMLRCLERHGEETGQFLMLRGRSTKTKLLLSTNKPHRSAGICVSPDRNTKSSPSMFCSGGINHLGQNQGLTLSKKGKKHNTQVYVGRTILKEGRHMKKTQKVTKLSGILLETTHLWSKLSKERDTLAS